jgi:hypothetical protein
MTVFTDTWDASYEGIPADIENVDLGANRIRDLKVAIRQRFVVDHSFLGDANDGAHTKSTYLSQGADPATAAGQGYVYSKTISGNVELFYRDSAGNVIQLTTLGALNAVAFPSGTRMMFVQSAPPLGWTQLAINDVLPRIVSDGSGGAGGGSWNITGTNVSTTTSTGTTTTTSPSLSGGIAVNGHVLTAAELPSHTHNFAISATATAFGSGGNPGYNTSGTLNGTTDGGNGLSGSAHSHTVTNTLGVSATSASVSTSTSASAFTNDGTWRPTYLNVLAASKN